MSNGGEKALDVNVCSPLKVVSFGSTCVGMREFWKSAKIANKGPYAKSAMCDKAGV